MLMCTVTVLTYFLAGVAKVTGPWDVVVDGRALREQIAVDALRKELLGEAHHRCFIRSSSNAVVRRHGRVAHHRAGARMLHRRLAHSWAIGAFLMHWGILFIMGIKFISLRV
jgi:hypothetical protein